MFFCTNCQPKVTVALKCINDLQDQQNALEAKVAKLEEELTTLSDSLKHLSKDPQKSKTNKVP